MSLSRDQLTRIGIADTVPRGSAILIPSAGTGGGGEYGANINDTLRIFAITREPVGHRIVFTVAHDIFDNWFTLELEGQEDKDASKNFNKAVQAELRRLKAKRELTRMAVFERAFGWSILVLGYIDAAKTLRGKLRQPTALKAIKAYGPPQINQVKTVKDRKDERYGLPEYYHIKRPGIASDLIVHYSRVIHFATRWIDPTQDEWKGQSVLDNIWDDLVVLRNIRWGMGQTMYRYGSGFPDLTFTGAELDQIEEWTTEGNFADLSSRIYFAHNENQSLEFKGLAGQALNPMPYYLPPMEHISCGTGIPLAILRGVQAGALTGSEVNQQEYYGIISDQQSAYEDGIHTLINILLLTQKLKTKAADADPREIQKAISAIAYAQEPSLEEKVAEWKFNWEGGFELSEEKKTAIELQKAQRWLIISNFMTRNEIRKAMDPNLEDLTAEQGGNEVIGRPNVAGQFGSSGYHVQHNPDGSTTVREINRKRPKPQKP